MTTETGDWIGLELSDGRYRVIAKLGEGGMGFVHRARDQRLGSDVVVKTPRLSALQDREFANRFAREIRSLVRLAHPHIVSVIDAGTALPSRPAYSLDHLQQGRDSRVAAITMHHCARRVDHCHFAKLAMHVDTNKMASLHRGLHALGFLGLHHRQFT